MLTQQILAGIEPLTLAICSSFPERTSLAETAFAKEHPQNSICSERNIGLGRRDIDLTIPSKMVKSSFHGSSPLEANTSGMLVNVMWWWGGKGLKNIILLKSIWLPILLRILHSCITVYFKIAELYTYIMQRQFSRTFPEARSLNVSH